MSAHFENRLGERARDATRLKRRRLLLASSAGALALAGVLAAPAAAPAQETYTLTMQATWPAGDEHFVNNFERWAEQVETHTGGRVQIETLPAGAVVPAFEVLDATSDRIIDGAHAASAYWVGKDRAAVLVQGGPAGAFGLDAWDYWGWIWEGGGHEVNNWFYQDHLGLDVVWFPSGSTGSQTLGWFNVELTSAADLQGLRLRIPGIPGEIYGTMGVSVITVPGGEILPAGERGVIDAAQYADPYIDLQMGFHDVWKYIYAPSYDQMVTTLEIFINKSSWDALPADIQAIITLVSREHHMWWEQHQQKNRRIAMDQLNELGVELRRTPQDILDQSLEAWHRILEEEYEVNEAFRRIADSQLEWASHVVVSKRILEPDYKELADVYWAPGGFVETADFLGLDYTAPPYYRAFTEDGASD
jgi:TRAP-type mannitol/chloroaromatic compound transport system substrate-binding protein